MGKILNFGSLNLDDIFRVDQFLTPGETRAALARTTCCGGKGLNQSLAAARAGAEVFHAGAVGDGDGAPLLQLLMDAGVDTERVLQRGEVASGRTVIQVDAQGQNCILLWGGANRSIQPEEVPTLLEGFGPEDLLLLQNETSCLEEAFQQGLTQQMKIALNPSPMDQSILHLPLDRCTYLFVNQGEGEMLCGRGEPHLLLEKMGRAFPKTEILLTLGADGALLRRPSGQVLYQPAFAVETIDTTGAGDTFTGYFLTMILEGKSSAEALRWSAAASALAVTRPGAAPSIPARDQVERWMMMQREK